MAPDLKRVGGQESPGTQEAAAALDVVTTHRLRRGMRWLEYGAKLAVVGVVYFLSGTLGLSLASINASASPVWPPTGIAIAAMVLFGYRMWPAVLAGAFLFNLATGTPTTSFLIGTGNTLEGLAGAWAMNRFAGGHAAFRTPKEALAFALLACGAAPLISATIGVTTLTTFGLAPDDLFRAIWTTWYLGDATGAVLVAPLIILWAQRPKIEWSAQEAMEAALLLLATFAIGLLVFSTSYPTAYVATPILLWAALRFGARETVTVSTILNGFAVVATSQGRGPFALADANQSLLTLQGHVAITTLIALFLAIVVAQRKESEKGLRRSRDTLESSVAERTSDLQSNVSVLNATLESTTDGLLVVDRGGRIERYNRQFVEMWNIPQDVLDTRDDSKPIGVVLSQLAKPDDFVAKVKALYADPKADSFDVLHFKDGRVVERYSKPQRVGEDIVGRVWSFRDVTERRRAEGLLQGVLENSTDVIYVMDRTGRFLLANPAFAAMFGRRVAEIIGKADQPWVPADVQAAGKKDDDRVYAANKPMTSEYTFPAAGMLRTFHTMKAPFLDASGNVIGILGVVRDITQRKQDDANRGRLASVVADSNDAITIQNLDGRITAWNKGAHAMYGYTEAEALQMNIRDTVPEDRREQALDLLRQAETGELVASLETQRRTKDGRILDVWLTTTKLLDEQGKITAIATTERDVTVLRAAEKERLEAYERSQEMARLQEVNRFKTQFLNTAAHELWTPLMPLRAQVHLLINSTTTPPAPSQKKALGIMERNLKRLAVLLDDLLTAAKSEAGRQGIEPQSIDLGKLLVEACEAYEIMAKDQGIEFTVTRAAGVTIVADPKRISQVLANLLSNAFKFTPKGGHIGVELEEKGAMVRIRVVDTGMGIAKLDLPRLFSAFAQVHDAAQVTTRGSGLGLYICKQFIELHGGTIGAESPGKGQGSTFWFRLPKIAIPPMPTPNLGAPTNEWTHDSPTNSNGPTNHPLPPSPGEMFPEAVRRLDVVAATNKVVAIARLPFLAHPLTALLLVAVSPSGPGASGDDNGAINSPEKFVWREAFAKPFTGSRNFTWRTDGSFGAQIEWVFTPAPGTQGGVTLNMRCGGSGEKHQHLLGHHGRPLSTQVGPPGTWKLDFEVANGYQGDVEVTLTST